MKSRATTDGESTQSCPTEDEHLINALLNGRLLARNTLLNLVGQGAPILVALIAIPILIDRLGTDRFGVLSIAWVTIGYFGLFDLGLGRAMTQVLASRLGKGEDDEVAPIAWTGLLLMFVLGCVGAVLLFVLSPTLVTRVLEIPPAIEDESLGAFRLLAVSLPAVISTAALRGILEANQRFDLVNVVRLPMGAFSFGGPLAVVPFTSSLTAVVAVLVVGRVVGWVAHLYLCLHALPQLRRVVVQGRGVIGPLVRVGGWVTVSNIISPIMVYSDRFLIGSILSMTAVAYYTTPYELVTKLWIITAALLGVLFPAFATSFLVDPKRTARLYDQGLRITLLIFFPITLTLVVFARGGLDLWLGAEFAENSTLVLQWLAIGIFINAMGQVAYTAIQGIGRADLTGKLHLLELPLYLVLLFWMLPAYGVVGAAAAWTIRVAMDTALLLTVAARLLPLERGVYARSLLILTPSVALLGLSASVQTIWGAVGVLIALTALYLIVGWRHVLTGEERHRAMVAFRSGDGSMDALREVRPS